MSTRVLVTGAAGKLGSAAVPALLAAGLAVRALVHVRPVHVPDGVETATADLVTGEGLERALDGADVVLHLAAVTHARRKRTYEAVNVSGTRSLVEAARASGVRRLVHVSTRAIDRSGGWYSSSKATAEEIVGRSGLEAVIVRLPEIYGLGGHEGIDEIVTRARLGRVIPVVGRGQSLVCPVHVDDAVAALVAAIRSADAAGRTYTLAGECLTLDALTRRCAAAAGGRSRVIHVPEAVVAVLGAAARVAPLPLVPDQLARLRAPKPPVSEEASRDLGFSPRPLSTGLAQVMQDGPAGHA
jgi:nucleoside-diphosphate-sugar epimerase